MYQENETQKENQQAQQRKQSSAGQKKNQIIDIFSKGLAILVVIFVFINSIVQAAYYSKCRLSAMLLALYWFGLSIILLTAQFDYQIVIVHFNLVGTGLGRAIFSIILGILILGNIWCQITSGVLFIVYAIFQIIVHFLNQREKKVDLSSITGVEQTMVN